MNRFKREYEFQKRRLTRKMSRSSFTTAWFFTVAICVLLFAYVLQVKENSEKFKNSENQSSLSSQSKSRGLKAEDALSPEKLKVKNMLEHLRANVSKEQDLLSASSRESGQELNGSGDTGFESSSRTSDISLSQETSPLAEEGSRSTGASRKFPEPNVLYSLKEKQENPESESSQSDGMSTIEMMKANALKKGYLLEIDEKTLDVISVIDMKTGEPVDYSF